MIALGSLIGIVTLLTVWVLLTNALVNDARREVAQVFDDVTGLSLENAFEPGVYAQTADDLDLLATSLGELGSRVRILRLTEPIPSLGGKVSRARHSIEAGTLFAASAAAVLRVYGGIVEDRRRDEVRTELSEADVASLATALEQLDALDSLIADDLSLDLEQHQSLAAAAAALRSLAFVAVEAPRVVQAGYDLLETVTVVRGFVEDPLQGLLSPDSVQASLTALMASSQVMATELANLQDDAHSVDLLVDLIAAADAAVRASIEIFNVMLDLTEGAFTAEFGVTVGARLLLADELLDSAASRVDAVLARFFPEVEGTPDGESTSGQRIVSSADSVIEQASTFVDVVRSLLGFDRPKSYLVLLQNQNEIRATGGFIGATAELRLTNGVLDEDLHFTDSGSVDVPPLVNNPPAPEPLFWYLWMGRMLFRDANWSPHFPASADQLMTMYETGRGAELDGVISVTKSLALDLVGTLGTVQVPGFDGLLTIEIADQFTEGQIPYECLPTHNSTRSKRCFDEDLVSAVVDELRNEQSTLQRDALVGLIVANLQNKTILSYMEDPNAQELLAKAGWAGVVPTASQDFIMVSDSSLPGHTTAMISKTWDYAIRLNSNGPSDANLNIHLHNSNTSPVGCRQSEETSDCYWNYLRVFLGSDATGIRVPSVPLHPGAEKLIWGHRELETARVVTHAEPGLVGLQEVGAFVVVEPNELVVVPIRYQTGSGAVRSVGTNRFEYRLLLVAQPGLARDRIVFKAELPVDARVVTVSPSDAVVDDQVVTWNGALSHDTEIVVTFVTGTATN